MDNLVLNHQFEVQKTTTSTSYRQKKFQSPSCPALPQPAAHPCLGHHPDLTGWSCHRCDGPHRCPLRVWRL